MPSRAYTKGAFGLLNGDIDFIADTIVALLLKSAYTHAPTHNFISDVVSEELGVSGYSRQTIGSKTITEDDTNHRVVFDGADPVFSELATGETPSWCVFARFTGNDATSEIISAIDIPDTPTNGGNITVAVPTTGILYAQI
jgi:hypothetical protein